MKAFAALSFLAAVGLVAGFDLRQLKTLQVEMSVNPKYTVEELQEIYAAQKVSPEHYGKADVPLDEKNQRITNGKVADRGQFPWQVAVIIESVAFCGGSLIGSQWILTAGHCAGSTYQILLGSNRRDTPDSGYVLATSSYSIVHSEYDLSTVNNDIALIKLSSEVEFTTYISPIRLRSIAGDLACESSRVSGWGRTADSYGPSPILMYADLTVISNIECALVYGNIITPTKICTSTAGGVNTCYGDSGGPLVYLESDGVYTQVGIASFIAAGGCQQDLPAGFTRVTSYLDWISSNTGIAVGY